MPSPRWRKSSFSGTTGDCVEVALLAGGVAVRDSKNADGPTLAFPQDVTSFVEKLAQAAPKNTMM
jgi:hypothetical protein